MQKSASQNYSHTGLLVLTDRKLRKSLVFRHSAVMLLFRLVSWGMLLGHVPNSNVLFGRDDQHLNHLNKDVSVVYRVAVPATVGGTPPNEDIARFCLRI